MGNISVARKRSDTRHNHKGTIWKAVKGSVAGLLFTVAAILVFALLVKQFDLSGEVISAADQVIKVLAICGAAYIAVHNLSKTTLLTGMLAGCLYVILGYLIFSWVQNHWGDTSLLLADMAMGGIIGLLVALIFTKLRSEPTKSSRMKT